MTAYFARDLILPIMLGFLLTITLINAGLGLLIGLYLTALGLPKAYVWGIAAFLLNFLPYLGGFIGTVLVAAFSILTFDSLGYALLAPIGYQILTGLEGQFVTPRLVGRRLALNTVAVFLENCILGLALGHPRRACGGAVFGGVQSDLREL